MKYKNKMTTITLMLTLGGASVSQIKVYAQPLDDANLQTNNYVNSVIQDGFINTTEVNSLNQNEKINRAEFFALVNNMLGFTDEANIYFSDVSMDAWYAPHIRKAVSAGYIRGFEDNTVRPTNNITRAEVSVVLNNILKLPTSAASSFTDSHLIPSWAYGAVNAIAGTGLLKDYPDGTFRSTNNITKADAIAILSLVQDLLFDHDTSTKEDLKEAESSVIEDDLEIRGDFGTEELQTVNGNVRIVGNLPTEVQNLHINGDLRIGVSLENNLVFLNNVTVTGTVYIYATNVHLLGNFNNVYINQENTHLSLRNSEETTVQNLNVLSGAANSRISLDRNARIQNADINAITAINGTGRIGIANIKVLGVTVTNSAIIERFAPNSWLPSIPNIASGGSGSDSSNGGSSGGSGSGSSSGGSSGNSDQAIENESPPKDELPEYNPLPETGSDQTQSLDVDKVILQMANNNLNDETILILTKELNNMHLNGELIQWKVKAGTYTIPIYSNNGDRILKTYLKLILGHEDGIHILDNEKRAIVTDVMLVGGENLSPGNFIVNIPSSLTSANASLLMNLEVLRQTVTISSSITLNLIDGVLTDTNQMAFINALNELEVLNWVSGTHNIKIHDSTSNTPENSLLTIITNTTDVTEAILTGTLSSGTYTLTIPHTATKYGNEIIVECKVTNINEIDSEPIVITNPLGYFGFRQSYSQMYELGSDSSDRLIASLRTMFLPTGVGTDTSLVQWINTGPHNIKIFKGSIDTISPVNSVGNLIINNMDANNAMPIITNSNITSLSTGPHTLIIPNSAIDTGERTGDIYVTINIVELKTLTQTAPYPITIANDDTKSDIVNQFNNVFSALNKEIGDTSLPKWNWTQNITNPTVIDVFKLNSESKELITGMTITTNHEPIVTIDETFFTTVASGIYKLIIPHNAVIGTDEKNIEVRFNVIREPEQPPIEDTLPDFDLEQVIVRRVIDGDTVELQDGRRVRLIGVNSPERGEDGFQEATDFTRNAVEGKVVYLEKDGNDTDAFGRFRRYIWLDKPLDIYDVNQVDSHMLNAQLLINNHAVVSIFGNVRLEAHFKSLYSAGN